MKLEPNKEIEIKELNFIIIQLMIVLTIGGIVFSKVGIDHSTRFSIITLLISLLLISLVNTLNHR